MKYTKNAPMKLGLLGFKFDYRHEGEEEGDAEYEVWRLEHVEATVDHGEKCIYFEIDGDLSTTTYDLEPGEALRLNELLSKKR